MERPKFVFADTPVNLWTVYDWIVEDPSYANRVEDSIMMVLIQLKPALLEYIKQPSKQLLTDLVKTNPRNIGWIKNPPKEIQLMAVSMEPSTINLLTNPCQEVKSLAAILA